VLVQLVPAVTELVISELLWLNYSAPEKPVYVYLNSIGSQGPDGQAVGFETEAYAILDTLAYIRPEIHTLVVGQAYGNAAMILASGKKGSRFSLPNARIMTAPPRMNRSFGSVSNMMIKANELEYNTQSYVDFLAQYTGTDSCCDICTLSCEAVDVLGCEDSKTFPGLLCDVSLMHCTAARFALPTIVTLVSNCHSATVEPFAC